MGHAALHCHTEFSPRDSLIRVDELPRLAKEAGWDACAITDHGGVEGTVGFVKACETYGVKPIVGCEVYVSVEGSDKFHHLTILVKNAIGFSSLCGLLSYAHANAYDGRKRKAAATIEAVLDLKECVVLSGCASSPFWRDEESLNVRELEMFKEKFGEDFALEVQPLFDWAYQGKLNARAYHYANRLGVPVVVTPDCHFGTDNDAQFHEALLAVASRERIGSPKAWKFSTGLNFLMTPEEITACLQATGVPEAAAWDALECTGMIAERIEAWSFDDLPAPTLPCVSEEPENELRVRAMAWINDNGKTGTEYEGRVQKELDAFAKGGLSSYLLLVRECVTLLAENGAEMGPRGSVGGSLVAYCLGLTSLDPITHALPWERFWAPGRVGMPDVDIDVDTAFRQDVGGILRKRFGEDKVAQISTVSRFKHRSAIRDAAKAYGVSIEGLEYDWKEEEAAETLEDLAAGRYLREQSPDAFEFANRLLGRVRQFGAHPGGFVISDKPLTYGRSCIVRRGKESAMVWDMKTAEGLGFAKLDFLGNSTLSALKAIEKIGGDSSFDWDGVPLDDIDVYRDFKAGRTAGVPQFNSAGMRMFVEMLGPRNFDELVWANAAFRPGGLGQLPPRELVEAYRRDPDGVIVYQEDVMQLCVGLAGFSWAEADAVRKIVAKSRGSDELEEWRDRFVTGCAEQESLTDQEAKLFWDTLAGFARYAFNKAHATSYTWNAYRIAWAKRKLGAGAFVALLNSDPDQEEALMDEAEEFGLKVLTAHFNTSYTEWREESGGLRPPLMRIPGVGLRLAKGILRRRAAKGIFQNEDDFRKRMKKIKYEDEVVDRGFSDGDAVLEALPDILDPQTIVDPELRTQIKECDKCELRGGCRAPVPPQFGDTNVVVLGDAPGRKEDRYGRPFIGSPGKLLEGALLNLGVERKSLTWTNVVKCRPPSPDYDESICGWIPEELGQLDPPLVLAVGRRAWHKMGGEGGILKANAKVVYGHPTVVACVSPAAVLRDPALLPEMERAVRKFAKLFKALRSRGKEAVTNG